MQKVNIMLEIERLRAELEQKIEAGGLDSVSIDNRLYELSMDIDELINAFMKEQRKANGR